MQLVLSVLISMITKLLTANFIQFAIIKLLEALVKRTENTVDDEFVSKIKEILEK